MAKITCKKVIRIFLKKYYLALDNPIVKKPVSYALYHTWKYFDEREKPREGSE